MKTSIATLVIILVFVSCKQETKKTETGTTNAPSKTEQTTDKVGTYNIVATGQKEFFNNTEKIDAPKKGEAFYGQDAGHIQNPSSYTDNGDGTITDNVTGLMWQKSYDVLSYEDAVEKLKTFELGGYSDWRLPTIKEAYSLMDYSGADPSEEDMDDHLQGAIPFIDTTYFDFKYGSNGHREIDTQLMTSTFYKGEALHSDQVMFGVNLADGRIKGYPIEMPGRKAEYTVRFVRGNQDYGKNNFKDNNDGTISDLATGLMWQKEDSKKGMNWQEALAYAQEKNDEKYLGHSDWRLPNAKELQSIVDYNRSPQGTNSAAISPLFEASAIIDEMNKEDFPFYWTSTTHKNATSNNKAVYICFGEALGFFGPPNSSEEKELMDVHGAGAQRSDPKSGDPGEYPEGHGPQGDVIRINNYARLVRDIE